ncbi:hypothetical protein BD626DRAFT_571934 [Schizophyllum amplum]|uniref:3'-5' exonuclease n=1 Tax=Schizophyllum amplum TaxID=97359 RepID=A0A550C5S3_9AGAR|nr:hypothetical protein BD626DRAFT_571934 [Auriculariopsis ampla]
MASIAGTTLAARAESEASQPLPPYTWRAYHPGARLSYCRTTSEADASIARISSAVVGFDMEWKPNFVKGELPNRVALVQVANDREIVLVQISSMKSFPERLQQLLGDPNVVKTGVGVDGDVKKLFQDWSISVNNVVDLSLLARSIDNANWKGKYNTPVALARLVEFYEARELVKGKVTHAANDAHCGWVLYTRFMTLLAAMIKQPKSVCYTFDALGGRLCEPGTTTQWVPANPDYDPGPPPPVLPPYSWSKFSPNAQVRYCRTVEEANTCVAKIDSLAIGFDIVLPRSSKTSEQASGRVPLILVADANWILLIQISNMRVFPEELRKLLHDPSVVKAGLIRASAARLHFGYTVNVLNIADLSLLARSVDKGRWKKGRYEESLSPRELVVAYEEHILPKNYDIIVKKTNWALPLTVEQALHAANSAHIRWRLYTKLASMLNSMKERPLPHCYKYDAYKGRLCQLGRNELWVPSNPDYSESKGKTKGGPAQREGRDGGGGTGGEGGRGRGRGLARGRGDFLVQQRAQSTQAFYTMMASGGPSSAVRRGPIPPGRPAKPSGSTARQTQQ